MVAPISVTSPSSTAGSSASCWALLKRWISSRKKIVERPASRRRRARSITSRTSARPALTAESSSKAASACSAASRASVVLPVPGGPNRTIECARPDSSAARSAEPSPSRCSWPTKSSSVRGRMRAASGPSEGASDGRVSSGGSSGASNRRSTEGSMVGRRAGAAEDRPARVGADRHDRVRRPSRAHRIAARADDRPARLDDRARVRGRQRDVPAAARPGLDADEHLLRVERPRHPGRAGRRARVHPAGARHHARDRGDRAAGRPARVGERHRAGSGGGRGGGGGAGRAAARRGEPARARAVRREPGRSPTRRPRARRP